MLSDRFVLITLCGERDCIFLAFGDAVSADYASGIVYFVVLYVDAGGLAVLSAEITANALAFVYHRTEDGEPCKETQHSSNRTDCVTVGSAVPPRQNQQYDTGRKRCCVEQHDQCYFDGRSPEETMRH